MKQIIKRGSFLTLMFMLLGCLSIQAADDDLITKQITIKLDEAGTLPNKIGNSKKNLITNLKIVGEVNGTDWCFIREMAGSDYYGNSTKGNLSVLDLSEAEIVYGGDYYYGDSHYSHYVNQYYSKCHTVYDEIGTNAFAGCSRLTSLTLPDGITSIGDYAFYDCWRLTSINIPASITYISDGAFDRCSGLTSLTLPDGITSIGNSALAGCSGLTSLTLPDGITSIHYSAFYGCSGLTSLTLPASITSIGGGAFEDCSGLKSINLPAGITEIKYYTFKGCSGLTSLNLPAGITEIGDGAFYGCSGLTSIYVYSEKVPKMYSDVFKGCDAKKCTVYVPKGTYDDYWLSDFGYFENIVEFDATGIDKTTTSTDVEEVSRYSVNGQRLVGPTKGLNIVKYSDGSVKKVAVQ